jgi:diguanylate cyclase (GGDEF)-like protein
LRTGDAIGRWGGEEFLAVLPSTDRRGAEIAADRIRQAVSTAAVVIRNELVPISVSIGAAARTNDHTNVLVAEADTAMYAAKAAGRNTVRVAR